MSFTWHHVHVFTVHPQGSTKKVKWLSNILIPNVLSSKFQ
uniref:Uncharacterized protein n=1 Tax=Nelumbo nucifera TaxID=4432 RepID=A0A822ZER2_NELNU|nr:TPA_asm: hypothetical protein HUJ06_001283 [Nelumbo nucifera]